MKIGLVPGSYKPYHAGHDAVIRLASKECDKVRVFVSLSDRKRPGEVPVKGSDMQTIWKNHIEPSLPPNVTVEYVSQPVRSVYEALGKANEAGSNDEYALYSDPTDLSQNFPEKNFMKYAGNLYASGKIIPRAVQRSETVDVSGTKMRDFLAKGDQASFIRNMPKTLNGKAVWDILSKSAASGPTPPKAAKTQKPAGNIASKNAVAKVPTAKAAATKKATKPNRAKSEAIELIRDFIFEAIRNR